MELTVATIGRAHGLRGEVGVEVRTDEPHERFVVGAVLATDPARRGPLEIARVRRQGPRWFLTFVGVTDRDQAEALRGVHLVVDVDSAADGDAWYPHELAGLRAEAPDGTLLGEVTGVEHLPAQDLLVLREVTGERTLVPFVRAIVPVVDVAGGRVVVDPPRGLLAADASAAEVVPPVPEPRDEA